MIVKFTSFNLSVQGASKAPVLFSTVLHLFRHHLHRSGPPIQECTTVHLFLNEQTSQLRTSQVTSLSFCHQMFSESHCCVPGSAQVVWRNSSRERAQSLWRRTDLSWASCCSSAQSFFMIWSPISRIKSFLNCFFHTCVVKTVFTLLRRFPLLGCTH